MAKLIEVIWTEERRGDGSQESPFRMVPQLWTTDGRLICEAENTVNPLMDGSGHFDDKAFHQVLVNLGVE